MNFLIQKGVKYTKKMIVRMLTKATAVIPRNNNSLLAPKKSSFEKMSSECRESPTDFPALYFLFGETQLLKQKSI
ncbi:hypothetical protein ACYCS5_27970 [Paenibacillus sp. SEL3]